MKAIPIRYTVGFSVTSVLAGAGCWFFGLDVIPSIVVAIVVAVLLFALRVLVRPSDNYEWPPAPPTQTDGDRREVSELEWALRTPRRLVEERIVARVGAIARAAVYRRHLDPANPAHRERIEQLVGPPVYLLLVSPDGVRMSVSSLLAVLRRLEALENPGATARP
jgi:hypothetical protein